MSDVHVTGFESYNFYRKFQNRRAKRNNGGIVVYVRNDIAKGVTIVQNHLDTIIWLRLDREYFFFEEDVFLCGAYIWGESSPMYNIENVDLFQILEASLS